MIRTLKLLLDYITIPKVYVKNECLVRILYSPYHISSKGKIKPNAFHPPPTRNDVSILRLNYCNESFCKNHGIRFSNDNKQYRGLAAFQNENFKSKFENENIPKLIVTKTFNLKDKIFLPMHGDVLMPKSIPGEPPSIELKRISKLIASICDTYEDKYPKTNSWNQKPIERTA